MGKRIASEQRPQTSDRSARKRKRSAVKASSRVEKRQRWSGNSPSTDDNNFYWHENDDEDSSSSASATNEEVPQTPQQPPPRAQCTLNSRASLLSLSHFASGGHQSDHNNSNANESPRPVYTLRPSLVNGTILRDVLSKAWRLGRPIGKGNFGEIFLASDDTVCPVSSDSAKYVVKIEPHSNGPLFVEIHCLINTNQTQRTTEENHSEILPARLNQGPPSGIPKYIASGTHYFGDGRYRFLVLPRFDRDLHSLIKNARVAQKSLLVLAINIINVLEHLHDKGYCHNDIKAQNLMISKCKYLKRTVPGESGDEHYEEKQQTTDSGNSSEQETNDDDYFIKSSKLEIKRLPTEYADEEDEDFDDGATTNSNNSNSLDMYQTPVNKNRRKPKIAAIEYSGSNPMRSCRRNDSRNSSSMYEEMVKSHYLRPTKRVSYTEFFNEDGYPVKTDINQSPVSSDNESEEFLPPYHMVKGKRGSAKVTRSSRRAEQKQAVKSEPEPDNNRRSTRTQLTQTEEEHIFLIDFGLASKYQDHGMHRPFIMDQRRAHDGTLEFTSRDAHLGAHSRRSDLECLGYNLLYWSEGYLPWKEVAQQQQQEKVHRAKELFMTDVCEMLKQFYGKLVPKYLGEFLQQIGKLSYQERPNYERYRGIFKREYRRLGYDCSRMRLSSEEIQRTKLASRDELDGCDLFELNNKIASNVLRNSALSTPFQEHSLTNRVSPKNLRSKSNKKNAKKKKFSWAEVLSQDPDQIARERAVKEFEREEVICPLQSRLPRRYEGRPTYAILAAEQCRRDKGLTVQEHNEEEVENDYIENEEDEEEEEEQGENNDEEEEEQEGEEEQEEEQAAATEPEAEASEADEEEMDVQTQQSDESESTTHSEAVRRGRGRPRASSKQSQGQPIGKSELVKNKSSRTRTTTKGSSNNSRNVQFQVQSRCIQPLTAVGGSNKRGCATRNNKEQHATLASATGEEVEHTKLKSNRKIDEDESNPKQRRRRPRRCLYKTELKMRGEQKDEDEDEDKDVENNSIYATSNMQHATATTIQYSAWKYDDENNSYNNNHKGRNVHSSRHCRK